VATIHRGATLTPHFRDFLPSWLARQPFYVGVGLPALAPVGFFRLEDPAGAVGIETHLLRDGETVYQLPMTYRDAPFLGAEHSLITTAEHSVLGTRWIYDGTADPVWIGRMLHLVRTEGVSEPSARPGVGDAAARGHLTGDADVLTSDGAAIELIRTVTARLVEPGPGILGLVTGRWYPAGPGSGAATGCLAVVRERRAPDSRQ